MKNLTNGLVAENFSFLAEEFPQFRTFFINFVKE